MLSAPLVDFLRGASGVLPNPAARPRQLIHVTPARNLPSLRAHGLVPSPNRHGRTSDPRTYFVTSGRVMLDVLAASLHEEARPDDVMEPYVKLVLDPDRIDPSVRFAPDREMPRGTAVWTSQSIPFSTVARVERLDLGFQEWDGWDGDE